MPFPRIAPKRKAVQWLATLLLLGIPFVRVGGDSLIRLDAPSRTLLFFGARVRIEEFYLFLIAVLIVVFGFLFVTMVFGRVWCGWLCPQTTLTDMVEYLDGKIDACGAGRALSGAAKHLLYLLVSGTVAANLVWYFIPPWEFFPRLFGGEIGRVAGTTLAAMSLLIYLDIVLVRRAFCRSICPYGRIQMMTMDRNTLTLEFDPPRADDCIRCGVCVKACPMGIDIKDGFQVECINCGRCIDACRAVRDDRPRPGLIHYTFGAGGTVGGHPVNARSMLLAGIMVLLGAILATGLATRKEATIKVQRGGEGKVQRLTDGSLVNYYSAFLENRGTTAAVYSIAVEPVTGCRAELVGPVRDIRLAANENRRVDFVVRIAPAPASQKEIRLLLQRDGKTLAVSSIALLVK